MLEYKLCQAEDMNKLSKYELQHLEATKSLLCKVWKQLWETVITDYIYWNFLATLLTGKSLGYGRSNMTVSIND